MISQKYFLCIDNNHQEPVPSIIGHRLKRSKGQEPFRKSCPIFPEVALDFFQNHRHIIPTSSPICSIT